MTDTDALTERLAEAVRETLMDDHGAGSDLAYVSWDGEQWLAVEGGIDIPHLIDAVLPIVVEEVQAAVEEYKSRQAQIHLDPAPPQMVPVRAHCPRCGHR